MTRRNAAIPTAATLRHDWRRDRERGYCGDEFELVHDSSIS
jgi:hypothetical protein